MTQLELFKDVFRDFESEYVLIGGTACEQWMEDAGLVFRSTKDVDMVLTLESNSPRFGQAFWNFVKKGGYRHLQKSTGQSQFYRFTQPIGSEYPYMIELFSKRASFIEEGVSLTVTPVTFEGEISSLSAILLDDAYYQLLQQGRVVLDGVSVLSPEYLIIFKAKAWLDLSHRREQGESIDSKDIKKHKNDIFRLAQLLTVETRLELTNEVRSDMQQFLEKIVEESIDMRSIGVRGTTQQQLMTVLANTYL